MRGKFIVLEGIDGSGKTTQARFLKERMEHGRGQAPGFKEMTPVYLTGECSKGPIGTLIREEFLSGKTSVSNTVLNDLFIIDRADHLKNPRDGGLIKMIDEGTNVICDRYVLSSMAYTLQNAANDPDIDPMLYRAMVQETSEKNVMNLYGLSPDLTIYIDIDEEEAMNRIDASRLDKSIYEKTEILKRIRNSYQRVMNFFDQDLRLVGTHTLEKRSPQIGPGKFLIYSSVSMSDQLINQHIKIVDGNGTAQEVSDRIFKLVEELF